MAVLLYLYEIIISVLVIPINVNCPANSTIPENAGIRLSMESWIEGSMIAGIIMFVSMGACYKDEAIFFTIAIFVLYNVFSLIWSIIGMTIFNDFYRNACMNIEKYGMFIKLGYCQS